MVGDIEAAFPGLRGGNYQVTSPQADNYNCIAWAANETTRWWWPEDSTDPDRPYWPERVPRVETLDAFREAFTLQGYIVCEGAGLEPGFEKVAIFADTRGIPKHAARQLPTGLWTSKLGLLEDIEHALHDVEGGAYGTVAMVMKRAIPTGLKKAREESP